MSDKLKYILETWPNGAIRTVSALKNLGYSQDLINKYRYSNWLSSVGEGAVILHKDKPTLLGAMYALQHDMKLDIHIGARSSLELRGRAHYARTGRQRVWLFGETKKLPAWFLNYEWDEDLRLNTSKFEKSAQDTGLVNFDHSSYQIKVSGDVLSLIETLTLVPKEISLEEAHDLMGGLTSAHPKEINALLQNYKSVKAKRLFLLLAELSGHQWLDLIDLSKIDLGKGVRQIVPGGKLNKKYQVIVPDTILRFEGTE